MLRVTESFECQASISCYSLCVQQGGQTSALKEAAHVCGVCTTFMNGVNTGDTGWLFLHCVYNKKEHLSLFYLPSLTSGFMLQKNTTVIIKHNLVLLCIFLLKHIKMYIILT